jgi:ribosomal-protein-alanine N-acetyltransferase
MPDFLEVKKEWGFFSEKDMELHQWDLCEACYDAFVKEFEIPVEIEEVMEL